MAGEERPQTVIVERSSGGGGFATIFFGAILLVAVLVGGYFLLNATQSETKKNDAISRAADKVGDTADKAKKAIPN